MGTLLALVLLFGAPAPVSAPAIASEATIPGIVVGSGAIVDVAVVVSDAGVSVSGPAEPSVAPAQPSIAISAGKMVLTEEPQTVAEAVGKVSTVVDLYKTGQWAVLALLLIQMLMFAFKKAASDAAKAKWGLTVSTGLGGLAAMLTIVIGGGTWLEGAFVFAAGPGMSVAYDLYKAHFHKKV